MGRLKPGATLEQARATLEGPFQQSVLEHRAARQAQSQNPIRPLEAKDYPRLAIDSGSQGEMNVKMILKQGMTLALIGILVGLSGAYVLTKYLESLTAMLFGVRPTDPFTFAGTAFVLTMVAMLACYLPARRATKVNPLEALRYE